MGSVHTRTESGLLFMDFKFRGLRRREQTALPDTPVNRKRLQKALQRIETEIAIGSFDYQKTFGKPLPERSNEAEETAEASAGTTLPSTKADTPLFRDFANQWFEEAEVTWRRSYTITQRGSLDKYLIPYFGEKAVCQITKADVLGFRALHPLPVIRMAARYACSTAGFGCTGDVEHVSCL